MDGVKTSVKLAAASERASTTVSNGLNFACEGEHMLPARRMTRMLAIAAMVLAQGTAHAQNFPNKPIRLVTVGAGGAMDFMSRLLATGLTANIGQPVIVDNR